MKGKVEISLVYNNLEFAGNPVIEKLDAELDGYRDSATLKKCITDSTVASDGLYTPLDNEVVLSGEDGSVEASSSNEINAGSGDYTETRLESPLLEDDDDDKYDFYKMLRRLMLTIRRKK